MSARKPWACRLMMFVSGCNRVRSQLGFGWTILAMHDPFTTLSALTQCHRCCIGASQKQSNVSATSSESTADLVSSTVLQTRPLSSGQNGCRTKP
jgi:hypothetical protein